MLVLKVGLQLVHRVMASRRHAESTNEIEMSRREFAIVM